MSTDALKAGRSTGAGAHGGRTPQRAGGRRGRAVGRPARQRRPDDPHVLRAAAASIPASVPIACCSSGCRCRRPSTRRSSSAIASRRSCSSASRPCRASRRRRSGIPFGGPQSPFAIVGQAADESKRIGDESGRRRSPAHVRHPAARRTDVRRRRSAARRPRRGDQRGGGQAVARRREPDRRAPAARRARRVRRRARLVDSHAAPEVTIVGIIANTRNAGLATEPTPVVVLPYSVVAPLQRHARGAHRRRSQSAAQPDSRRRCGRWIADQPLGRPITLSEILGQEVDPAALHDGAVQRVRGARAGARRRRHLQRAVVPRDPAHARTRRAHGARRAAPPRARPDADDGRPARARSGSAVGVAVSLASTRLLRSQLFGVQPADPLSYVAVAVLLACRRARRLLHSRPAARQASIRWSRCGRSDSITDH